MANSDIYKTVIRNKPDKKLLLFLKRVGIWGSLFFLVKGILWLTLPAILVYLELK